MRRRGREEERGELRGRTNGDASGDAQLVRVVVGVERIQRTKPLCRGEDMSIVPCASVIVFGGVLGGRGLCGNWNLRNPIARGRNRPR